ncbi:cysteine-tryptophan domain-containing zinc finger protein 7-like isoform X2 [Humulus lupulus]|uniref:cysteine-tryptophan domain-containing zinc finger protein 7-like isoform X2 n=1 Tax=Humulus lupulus TaxID=3486 RepID=UPI002B41286A|nr:cysteine-tryptophan domain-containing zinc finger protein 7-like isoform X2 [Humulus lupulus]
MISVGTRDATKGLGLGFGGGSLREDMEDTELEEGEACSYQNSDDANIDPDVAYSYLDEKLQDVLGHFKKDFEGGVVSAENLGAKFGGYGSFLPAHQRSPAWSHRTPPKVQSYSASRSPNNLHMEGGHCNSVVSSTAPQSGGLGPTSTSSTSFHVLKASSVNESGKQEVSMPATRAEEIAPRLDSKNKKPTSASDQKTLKVRIKVGSDNLSTRKNAAIYSGLGLDDSPSSSLDDSPSESEGISHERPDASFDSPTSILQIMTSFPVNGGLLLSPLRDDLTGLMEKEKLSKDSRFVPHPKGVVESSGLIIGSDNYLKSGRKVLGEKNVKSMDMNDYSAESKSVNDKVPRIRDMSRKEPDLDALACEELVSNTLKLPILSHLYSTSGDMRRCKEINKSIPKEKVLSDRIEEQTESTFTRGDGQVEKQKPSSAGKGLVDGKESSINEISALLHKGGQLKEDKGLDLIKADSNATKARKTSNTEAIDSSKQKSKKAPSKEQDNTRLLHGMENPVPGEKKKLKGSHGSSSALVPKESLKAGSLMPKTKKGTNMDTFVSNSDGENVKSRKDIGKTMDTYKDFFGELDEEDNPMNSLADPYEDKPRESVGFAKSTPAINGLTKERLSGKKIEKPSMSEANPLTASSPRSGNGFFSDAAPPTGPPELIQENWVCCDKCQQWRLLPFGTNPEDLPEKWVCSMLDWLPGMNQCCFTEEETTKARFALYPHPVPHSQTDLNSNPGGYFTEATLANFRHPDQNPRDSSGKKKQSLKLMSNSANKDSPTQLPNSTKKNMQVSLKSRSLNDVNNSPLASDPDFPLLSKANDLIPDDKKRDTKNLKMKSRRDSDRDSSRASKKIKTQAKNGVDEDWASDHSGAIGKVGPSSGGGFPTSSAGKDRMKYSDRSSSRDSKFDVKDCLQVPIMKANGKVEVVPENGSLERGRTESRENMKKRKSKEFPNGSCPSTGRLPDSTPFVKEFSDNDHRKEKKPRISISDGKESSASKCKDRTDKKRSHSKSQLHTRDLGITQPNLDAMDLSKRGLGPIQPSLAATSSSSKVSGSHKTKSSFQEVKGSPVESVSSSPMRISNPDKISTISKDVFVKEEFPHAGNYAIRSPKRSSDGEDYGGRDHTRVGRKNNASNGANHRSQESSLHDSQERDFNHMSITKHKIQVVSGVTNLMSVNGPLDNLGPDAEYPSKPLASGNFGDEEKQNESHYHANGSRPRKSAKGSSSRLEKNRSFKSEFDTVKVKSSDAVGELHGCSPIGDIKSRDGKNKLQEKYGVKSDKVDEKILNNKRYATGKPSTESCKRENELNVGGCDDVDLKVDAICRKDVVSTPQQNVLIDSNDDRSSKRLVSDKADKVETVSSGERSVILPPSGGPQGDILNPFPQPGTGSHKGNGVDTSHADTSEGNNVLKVQKQIRKADNQNRSQQTGSRNPSKNGHRVRDLDVPPNAATNALKEATNLKHMADRLKSAGSTHERTGLYFEAALKFLYGASLLESGCSESTSHSEMVRSRQTYSDTAKLCEFCACEYEKSKDMASAALAYKCTEVAYMRVVYSLHLSASRDRHELQTALQVAPIGESPSSSASDVDNLNNHTIADKASLAKGASSPQVAANHVVIAARNRSSFDKVLTFAQDTIFAMEASKKSQVAFAAASTASLAEAKSGEAISSIKRALDFNFQDVDGLLRLVRLAMEAISR